MKYKALKIRTSLEYNLLKKKLILKFGIIQKSAIRCLDMPPTQSFEIKQPRRLSVFHSTIKKSFINSKLIDWTTNYDYNLSG